ncbi:uncharacterized protein LOC143262111 [Megalopta genalis]|uniref:uncharacterized protein LOC143262111 n=1 Tax=Megalopta genalis TaxID=115081 RepID=UPI003FD456FA
MADQGRVLNALTMSIDTAKHTPPRATALSERDFRRSIVSTVDRPSRKPNWQSARSGPTRDRCLARRAAMIFSKILPTSSRRQMGRYAEGESAGLPSFLKRTIRLLLQRSGNTPDLRSPEKRLLSLPPRTLMASNQTRPGIPADRTSELSESFVDFS